MKKFLITLFLFVICLTSHAQIKVHSNGQVSIQSLTQTGGIQFEVSGKTSFEPNITQSYAILTQSKAPSLLSKLWTVHFTGTPAVLPYDRFYVTGNGDVYSNGQYSISMGGGSNKGSHPIVNASELLVSLKGYYYDNYVSEYYPSDFIDNPNVSPEAVEGLMSDLTINKSLGLSVAELEEVLPEAIRHDPEGMVYINYQALVPVLVEAFKEQQEKIEQLEAVLKEKGLLKP